MKKKSVKKVPKKNRALSSGALAPGNVSTRPSSDLNWDEHNPFDPPVKRNLKAIAEEDFVEVKTLDELEHYFKDVEAGFHGSN